MGKREFNLAFYAHSSYLHIKTKMKLIEEIFHARNMINLSRPFYCQMILLFIAKRTFSSAIVSKKDDYSFPSNNK